MNYVIKLNKNQQLIISNMLVNEGFEKKETNNSIIFRNEYTIVTFYSSDKVMFQGKEIEKWKLKVAELFDIGITDDKVKSADQENVNFPIPRIGTDESGKGDFFGPLVTVAFYINNENDLEKLINLGVKDSKLLNDTAIREMSKEITKVGMQDIILITPKTYNSLYDKMRNVNNLLAWSHARAIENILSKVSDCSFAVADQFGDEKLILNSLQEKGKTITLHQMHKAEQDVVVAAASIVARNAFITWLQRASVQSGFEIPRGSNKNVIDVGKRLISEKGKNYLSEVAKIHFKTYHDILG